MPSARATLSRQVWIVALLAGGCGGSPPPADAARPDVHARDTDATASDVAGQVDAGAADAFSPRDAGATDTGTPDALPPRDAGATDAAPRRDGGAADSGVSARALASARVLGYVFGDGNYSAPLVGAPPRDAVLRSGGGAVRTDFVAAACDAGYAGKIFVGSPAQLYDCVRRPAAGSAPLTVSAFAWPFGGDFARFVAEATPVEQREFLGAMLTGEAGRCGGIDDQSCGFDGYTTGARINAKMDALAQLLRSLGFATANVSLRASGGTTGCSGTGRVRVESTDFCRFNSRYGFRFVTYARVPGSVCPGVPMCTAGDATCTEPPRCP